MVVSPSCDLSLQLVAGAQCRFGYLRRSGFAGGDKKRVTALSTAEGVEGIGVVFAGGEESGIEEGVEELDGEGVPVRAQRGTENEGGHGDGAEEKSCAGPQAEDEEEADHGFEEDEADGEGADDDGWERSRYEELYGGVGEGGEMGKADEAMHEDAEAKREAEDQLSEFAIEMRLRIQGRGASFEIFLSALI